MKKMSPLAALARDHNWGMGQLRGREASLKGLFRNPDAAKLIEVAFREERKYRNDVYEQRKNEIKIHEYPAK